MKNSILTKHQVKQFTKGNVLVDGERVDIVVTVRYDDQCGNGHNSFAITGEYWEAGKPHTDRNSFGGGCIHEAIEQAFPELKPYLKWHLTSSDEPMHYVANTVYHAQDTDYNGLKKGEYGSHTIDIMVDSDVGSGMRSVYCSGAIYTNKQNNPNLAKSNDKERAKLDEAISSIKPELNPVEVVTPCSYSKSEGKESDLDAARRCAIWPDATLEQLLDKEQLNARLPALMAEFAHDVESLGFTY